MPSSPDFNAQCYVSRYPDLKLNRFIIYNRDGLFGMGSSANSAYSDLIKIEIKVTGKFTSLVALGTLKQYQMPADAYLHYKDWGMAEGRAGGCDLPGTNYDNLFNSKAYVARYPDVKENPDYAIDPVGHYQTIGMKQGRIPGYEILSELSPGGFTSPGTTEFISNQYIQQEQSTKEAKTTNTGDNTVITAPAPVTTTPPTAVPVSGNTLIYIGAAGLLLIVLMSKKNKKKKSHE